MDNKTKEMIEQYLNQILAAADHIQSVGARATANNASQLLGIHRAAGEIARIINQEPDGEEDQHGQ